MEQIKTPLVEKSMDAAALNALERMHALATLGETSEVAEPIFWLSSDKASFVTGSHYAGDGGSLAQ